jgi:hypothetical protein
MPEEEDSISCFGMDGEVYGEVLPYALHGYLISKYIPQH